MSLLTPPPHLTLLQRDLNPPWWLPTSPTPAHSLSHSFSLGAFHTKQLVTIWITSISLTGLLKSSLTIHPSSTYLFFANSSLFLQLFSCIFFVPVFNQLPYPCNPRNAIHASSFHPTSERVLDGCS